MSEGGSTGGGAAEVSAAEIARIAGVTRATVSNWRRRHDDFPRAVAGSESRPRFDLRTVRQWLAERGVDGEQSPEALLRTTIRSRVTPGEAARVLGAVRSARARGLSGAVAELATEVGDALARGGDAETVRATLDVVAEWAMGDAAATGVYVTPAPVAMLMAALLGSASTPDVHSVLDPACGSGSLLLAAAQAGATELYGQDVLPVQVDRSRLLLDVVAKREPVLRSEDSLIADGFGELRVDGVLCNPPYGQRDWGAAELAFDPRWDHGLPPRGESELAWVQHGLAHLRFGGVAAILLPPAVATRAAGRKIRANLLRSGALRAVVGLAPGVAQPWHVGLQIWVLRRPDPVAQVPDSVLFIDTTGAEFDRNTVIRAWREFDGGNADAATESGVSVVVRLVDALDDEVDLTPARYVRSSLDGVALAGAVDAAIGDLALVARELASVAGTLPDRAAAEGRAWRFVSIGDLVNHGQLHWIRALPPNSEPIPEEHRRVLTAPDVATGTPASGVAGSVAPAQLVEVRQGDVLMPAVRSDRDGGRRARVAGAEDAGAILGPHVHILRVDHERLDPWFLTGFLGGADNVAVTRTATVRFDPSRLRIPVLSIEEQRRYGELFRLLFRTRTVALRAGAAADHVAELIGTGLTAGVLAPRGSAEK